MSNELTPEQRAARAYPCLLIAVKRCRLLFPHDMPWCDNCRHAEIVAQQIREAVEAERADEARIIDGVTETCEAHKAEYARKTAAAEAERDELVAICNSEYSKLVGEYESLAGERAQLNAQLAEAKAERDDYQAAAQVEARRGDDLSVQIHDLEAQLTRYKRVVEAARAHVLAESTADDYTTGLALDAALAECEP